MSNSAEDISATLSSQESSAEPIDAIAALLVEDTETEDQDVTEEETLDQASTESEEEESDDEEAGDEHEESDEETDLEQVADGEVTWEGMLGISEDSMSFGDDGNVVGIKTKVNGEEEIVSMTDLVAGYQNNKHVTQKGQAHAEAVKEFEVQKGQVEQVYASKLDSVDALSKHFEKQLVAEFDNINWQQLRQDNPAEYAALKSDFAAKANELKSIQDAITEDKATVNQEQVDSRAVNHKAYMKTQYEAMIEKNPEWSDEKVRNTAQEGFKSFVKEQYGFTDADWSLVYDARLIELVKDAKKYRDGAAVAGKKRLKTVPKFQKSRGKGLKPKTSKLEKLTSAAKKAKGHQKRDLQAGAVAELLLGG
jgi:hypothetical protein